MPLSFVLEIIALLISLVIAAAVPDSGNRIFGRTERLGSKIAVRETLCWQATAALVVLIRALLLAIWSIPRPRIHDEFAYLLGAATFAAGRLTNPSPKLWQFFEAPHILVTPTYQSMYPPAQSVVLASGTVLLGHPWFGVLLSCAGMSAAIVWMLQGWMPARWALLGGLLSLVRLAICSYWMNSYWGGAVAAIGGCLVMGAYPRIVRQRRFGYAWAMGIGLIVLANSRPFEGAVSSLPVGVALLYWAWNQHRLVPRSPFSQLATPLLFCAMVGALLTGYYNYRVTGHALLMPYREHAEQYQQVPLLLPMNLPGRNIRYRNADIQYQYEIWELSQFKEGREQYLGGRWRYVIFGDHETLGILLMAPMVMLPWALRDGRLRLIFVCSIVTALHLLVEHGAWPHYAAPQIGSFFGLVVQCIRHLRAGRRGKLRQAGRFLSRALPVASVVCFTGFGISSGQENGWKETLTPVQQRPEAEATLVAASKGKAIVFVRYHFDPRMTEPFEDWNYNSPDLADAPVLWVHDMGRTDNEKLLRAYPGRTPWYFSVDYSNGLATRTEFSAYDQTSSR